MSSPSKEIGSKIRKIREAVGMSRDDFADAVGVPPTTLKNYEMGYREVGGEFLMKLSSNQQFHRFTLWLLSGKKEPSVGQIGPEDFVKV